MGLEPHPDFDGLKDRLAEGKAALRRFSGACYRFAAPRYAGPTELVSGEGARRFGSRWLPPGVAAAVHGSTRPELAMAESLAQHRRANIPDWEAMPLVVCGVRVVVGRMLDLTERENRRALRISLDRLLGVDWRAENTAGRESLSQAVGRAAFADLRIEALLVPSAVDGPGANLVVFPARLAGRSRLSALQPRT